MVFQTGSYCEDTLGLKFAYLCWSWHCCDPFSSFNILWQSSNPFSVCGLRVCLEDFLLCVVLWFSSVVLNLLRAEYNKLYSKLMGRPCVTIREGKKEKKRFSVVFLNLSTAELLSQLQLTSMPNAFILPIRPYGYWWSVLHKVLSQLFQNTCSSIWCFFGSPPKN